MSAEQNVIIQQKILLFAACCLLVSCANSPEVEEQVEQAVKVLYQDALNTAIEGDPQDAAPKFEEVERQHPYSKLATRAQVMAAWSFYEANQYSRAIAALDRFIELNPADPLVEYAYYLKALCFYEQCPPNKKGQSLCNDQLVWTRGSFCANRSIKYWSDDDLDWQSICTCWKIQFPDIKP